MKQIKAYIYKRMPQQAKEILENLLQYREEIDTLSVETILLELGKIAHTFDKDYDKADELHTELNAIINTIYS